jgi:uncharacterized protein (TIGR02268 family)
MPVPSPAATPLLLALLTGSPLLVPPAPAPWDIGAARYLELREEDSGPEHEVLISPGRTLTFVFNAPLLSEGVLLEERELFHVVMVDEAHGMLTLLPSGALPPGKVLRLTVRFADGAVPAGAHFRLVVHPTRAEPQVNVYRQPRPPESESYQWQWRQERERAERCEERWARAEAERGPGGLVGLLESGLVDEKNGVAVRDITSTITQSPGAPLQKQTASSYRARNRVAVDVVLGNTSPQPWTLEGAELVGKGGARLDVLRVWPLEPVAPGQWSHVRVEAEATEEEARGTWVLELSEAGGARTVTVRGVTFP